MTGFAGVRQPARGGLATALTVILSFVIPALLVYGYGKLDPAFSDVNGAGFGAAGLVVLIGFYGFGIVATGMEGWPWSDSGLSPLAIGFAQIFSGACITGVGYALLIYPNVSTNASSHSILVTLPVAVGWFYSVIVAWLTTFLILDNWPWNVFTQRKYRALAALAGNVALGTVIYIGHLQLLGWGLIPANAISKLGVALPSWTAQLGVWIAFWLIFWANVAGNWPNQLSAAKNRLIRCAICWTLGALSFFVYTRWFSQMVLHEKEVVPGFGGDPLTWVDLLNYVMLIYAVYFEFFGFSKRTGVT
ncbi:hypothetical protein KDX11_37240 [Burkholderia cenocepacia]|uniref:hypothetical protein n=1 Tax=Burkholderia cenocepacia TaxID=95486 RepID=UPI001B94465E|nr:hypothetical protein [Burkholderia cenocepacia]MBR8394953.1 hypothetical protein [Burkholderia cenocepacia]